MLCILTNESLRHLGHRHYWKVGGLEGTKDAYMYSSREHFSNALFGNVVTDVLSTLPERGHFTRAFIVETAEKPYTVFQYIYIMYFLWKTANACVWIK